VGTGKTTLSRKLIQELKSREDFIFTIILDSSFETEYLFLTSLVKNFESTIHNATNPTILDLREAIERFLFQRGVNENKTIALVIDEAQKLNDSSLEILRVLLNYETNEYKLLQLVLLGQLELHSKIMNIPNFFDRISFKYTLNPLDAHETKEMVEFRIRQAGYKPKMHIFLEEAVKEIYHLSRGYPRQITMLCYRALKSLVLKNKYVIDAELIHELIEEETRLGWHRDNDLFKKAIRVS
jgi:general secretion pathway protein A